jgi:serine/threonine protein kinase
MHREVVSLDVLSKNGLKVPHVVDGNTEEYDNPDVPLYFVMEHIPGTTLKVEISARGPLTLEKAVALVADLGATVAGAHALDVLHRDLKPDNIMVRSFASGDLVIVDYGLSFNDETEEDTDLTHTDEQFRNRFLALPETNTPGGDRRDKRSDITALGAILYYCLTSHVPGHLRDGRGRAPHRRDGFSFAGTLTQDPRRHHIELLLDRAFEIEIENRFQSIDEFRSRIRSALTLTEPADDDPKSVAAEIARELRQRHRPFRLAEIHRQCQEFSQRLHHFVNGANQSIQPQFQISLGSGFLLEAPAPDGFELVSEALTVTVTMPGHQVGQSILLGIFSQGNQCALLYRLCRRDQQSAAGELCSDWRELFWFDPAQFPEREAFVPPLNRALTQALRHLGKDALSSLDLPT